MISNILRHLMFMAWLAEALSAWGQPLVQGNYLRERTFTSADGTASLERITYHDGLGRPVELVARGFSPTQADHVMLTEYDRMGRDSCRWLSAAMPTGDGLYAAVSDLAPAVCSAYSDAKAYATILYEPSPFGRPTCETGPGSAWHDTGRGVSTSYLLSSTGDAALTCLHYTMSGTTLTNHGSYLSGELRVTRTTDEDGRVRLSFTDGRSQVVLSRQLLGEGQQADTYFVYDDNGDLLCVLPPAASAETSATGSYPAVAGGTLARLAYLYQYDSRRRLTGRRLPGCDWTHYVYDNADRLVATQDGNQRLRGKSSFCIPDLFGRVCLTGECSGLPMLTGDVVTARYTGSGGQYHGYTLENITLDSVEVHNVSYYDSYDFLTLDDMPSTQLSYVEDAEYGERYSNAKMRLTGTATLALGSGTQRYLYAAMYYDAHDRLIQRRSTNYLRGYDVTCMLYDFTGHPLRKLHTHTAPGKTTLTELYSYSYDHAGRHLTTRYRLNGFPEVTLTSNTYDELGRLASVSRHGSSTLTTNYAYNTRGWPVSIEGGLFREQLFYHAAHNGGVPQYGGNVSAIDWQAGPSHAVGTAGDPIRGYGFRYDALSRLTQADYFENGAASAKYDTGYSYDLMGNMLSLMRNGRLDDGSFGTIDDVTLSYEGNQLNKADDEAGDLTYAGAYNFTDAADATAEYTYDANGNMTSDLNKDITQIQYNVLNLPQHITFGGGASQKNVYAADGRKLYVEHFVPYDMVVGPLEPVFEDGTGHTGSIFPAPSTEGAAPSTLLGGGTVYEPFPQTPGSTIRTYYCGNIVYQGSSNRPAYILTEGGYVTLSGYPYVPTYHYYLQDHLGNNRVVAQADGTIEQVNHYYPFGGLMAESQGGDIQRYKYNGKELDRLNGIDWYDYGARHYDGVRFTTVDPSAHYYYQFSPYAYCLDNPVKNVDPDGRSVWSRLFKTLFKTSRIVAKNGLSSLREIETYASSVSDFTDAATTIADQEASVSEKIMAGISIATEIAPVSVGDIKDVRRLIETLTHGNSQMSSKAQHAYDIINTLTNKVVKTGISGGKIKKNGKSMRAESQVNKWNKELKETIYESRITHTEPAGEGARTRILQYEKERANTLRKDLQTENKHKRP